MINVSFCFAKAHNFSIFDSCTQNPYYKELMQCAMRRPNSTTWGRTPPLLPAPSPLPQLISFKLARIVRSNEFIFHRVSLSFASGRISFLNACDISYSSKFSDLHWVKYWANMPILVNTTNSMRYICFAQQNVKIYGDIQL